MAASLTEKCLIEKTQESDLMVNQRSDVKDKENARENIEEPLEEEDESKSLRTKESLRSSSKIKSYKTRPQMVKPGEGVPKWLSKRWIFCYLSFGGMMFVFVVRMGITVAIVCMVKEKIPLNNTNLTIDPSCAPSVIDLNEHDRGEFEWSDSLVSNILAAFYYGYAVTNLPGGFLADKYGGRRVFGYSLLTSSLILLFYPVLSRVSGILTLILRIFSGLLAGPFFPAMHSLWGRWAPPIERSRLVAISYTGPFIGNIATMTLSGYLCAYGFDNGWGSVFYLTGTSATLYSLIWLYFVRDNPQTHPTITVEERDFLDKAIQCKARVKNIPWKSIMTSGAVWAIICAHFCFNWSVFTFQTVLPLFMKEVLYFDIKSNGFMSSVPYFGQLISYFSTGYVADIIIRRGYLTIRGTRVLMQCTSFIGAASFFIATSFIKCSDAMVAIWFLFFAGLFMGLSSVGFVVNHVDIAPSYAGLLMGVTNTISALPGFLAPTVATALTPNGTQEEWQKVFVVCSCFAVFGAVMFAILAKAEVQEWANHSHKERAEIEEDGNSFSKI